MKELTTVIGGLTTSFAEKTTLSVEHTGRVLAAEARQKAKQRHWFLRRGKREEMEDALRLLHVCVYLPLARLGRTAAPHAASLSAIVSASAVAAS